MNQSFAKRVSLDQYVINILLLEVTIISTLVKSISSYHLLELCMELVKDSSSEQFRGLCHIWLHRGQDKRSTYPGLSVPRAFGLPAFAMLTAKKELHAPVVYVLVLHEPFVYIQGTIWCWAPMWLARFYFESGFTIIVNTS